MPIYEYRCRRCGERSSFFVRTMDTPLDPECSYCQSREMQRALSSFACHRSVRAVHEDYGPPPGPGVPSLDYYKDPRNVGRHVEESFRKYGMEVPQSVRDTIDAAREGELPKGLDL